MLPTAVFKDNTPFSLHFVMFIPAIMGQATEEQKEYWLKRARNMDIIGTYAQVSNITFGSSRYEMEFVSLACS